MKDLVELKELTVLFADDDEIFLNATKKTLEMLFKHVYVASHGTEALHLYKEIHPNIIMLDIRMGIFGGLDVAKEIRKENQFVPIFIISSYTETHELLDACRLNLVDYITKPFSFQTLLQAFRKCISMLKAQGSLSKIINASTSYNPSSKTLIKDGVPVSLTKNELIILELLLQQRGKVASYETLINCLGNEISYAALQNLVLRLRKKLGEDSIHNLSKVGYIIK